MTPIREAIALPAMFLTVVLLGGLRVNGGLRFVDPPLAALVLGLLLIASLVRAGVFRPGVFMHGSRSGIENVSGAIVLVTLYGASAQVFHLVTPERGLLHLLFGAFFFIQLLTTMAGGAGRIGFLRSLVVLLGSAFVLRWIVLEALYAPDSGLLKRIFTAVAEGITLGAIEYAPHDPFTGYTAFFAIALYLAGVALLAPPPRGGLVRAPAPRGQHPSLGSKPDARFAPEDSTSAGALPPSAS